MNEVVDEIYENETAEELYERIEREKERLISEGKLKKQKKLPEISEDEIPFEIPKSWKWVRLESIVLNISTNGKQIQQKEILKTGKIPVISQSLNMIEGFSNDENKIIDINSEPVIIFGDHSKTLKFVDFNFIVGADGTKILKPMGYMNEKCLYYFLKYNVDDIENRGYSRYFRFLREKLIPLPPLSEQKRISELIDRLFEKLDEAKEKALSALNTFELRKAKILHLAIQGKLSKQLDEYKTAEELYEKIQIEKEKLISEGKLKKQKKLPEISEDEIPFEIPKSWKWVRLGELSDTKDNSFADGPFGSNLKKEHYINEPEVRIIQISNIGEEGWKNENVKYTSFIHAETIKRSMVSCGDIVITKMMPAGRAIQVPDIEKNYILSSDVIKFVPHPLINRKYLLYSINSNVFKNQIYDEVQGITRVRTSLMKIKSYLIPLPPLEEQKEIVKLLDNIFEKEEKAKKLIESTLNKIELVKKSILARAVRGEL